MKKSCVTCSNLKCNRYLNCVGIKKKPNRITVCNRWFNYNENEINEVENILTEDGSGLFLSKFGYGIGYTTDPMTNDELSLFYDPKRDIIVVRKNKKIRSVMYTDFWYLKEFVGDLDACIDFLLEYCEHDEYEEGDDDFHGSNVVV